MSLRSGEQVVYPGCDIFLARVISKEDGTQVIGPMRDAGSVQQIPNVTFNTQRNEIRSPRRGQLVTLDSRVIETTEQYPLVLYNFSIDNLAMVFGGEVLEFTQAAVAVATEPHNVYPDSCLQLYNAAGGRAFNVSDTGITIEKLTVNTHYTLAEEDLRQGRIKILPDAEGVMTLNADGYEELDVSFTPAAMSGRRLILPRTDVIQEYEAEIVYPENGPEAGFMRTGLRVTVEPGNTNWNQREGSTLAATLTVLAAANLDEPYGRLIQYKGTLPDFTV
jgi:hypothetical protein